MTQNNIINSLGEKAKKGKEKIKDAIATVSVGDKKPPTPRQVYRKERKALRKSRIEKVASLQMAKRKEKPPMNKILRRILLGFKILVLILVTVVIAFGVFFNLIMEWMHQTWPHLTMTELTHVMRNPTRGTSPELIDTAIQSVVPTTATVLVIVLVIMSLLLIFKRRVIFWVASVAFTTIGIGIFLNTAVEAVEQLEIIEHIERQSIISDFMGENYVNPHHFYFEFPEEKRNLIFIYVESTEVTFTDYANGGAMSFNAIPELTQIAHDNEDFSGNSPFINGAHVLPGGSWTIAGMFSQTAGLPLNIPVPRNEMNLQDSFFPEILTLGGILDQAGYYQGLLVGSDAVFGGRYLYYTTHGNFTIWDYYYAHDTGLIPYGHRVWWGFEDWRLFGIAKDKILDMASGDAPFHLTMLTVDTHRPHGWSCEYCPNYFYDQMANVFLCSSRQIYDFVNWIKDQDFFENTTIILSGDHLTMDADFVEYVPWDYQRLTYVAIINAPIEVEDPTLHRKFSTLDMFPTTLAALGVEIPGNRLGLGTNLFSSVPTLLERYGLRYVYAELDKGSDFMEVLTADIEYDDFEYVLQNPELITLFQFDEERGLLSFLVSQRVSDYLRNHEFMASAWSNELQTDIQWASGVNAEDGTVVVTIPINSATFWGSQITVQLVNVDLRGRHNVIYEVQMPNPHFTGH
jgi:phosphoglycerol transferase